MSAQRSQLLSSAARTTSSNSEAFDVKTGSMAAVAIEVTAVATCTDFTAFMQGSPDGGDTWFDLVADHVAVHSGGQSDGGITSADRDIFDGITAAAKAIAVYKHVPVDKVRLAWYLDAVSVTFEAWMVTK